MTSKLLKWALITDRGIYGVLSTVPRLEGGLEFLVWWILVNTGIKVKKAHVSLVGLGQSQTWLIQRAIGTSRFITDVIQGWDNIPPGVGRVWWSIIKLQEILFWWYIENETTDELTSVEWNLSFRHSIRRHRDLLRLSAEVARKQPWFKHDQEQDSRTDLSLGNIDNELDGSEILREWVSILHKF
jgi:hypothetical protein